MYDLYESKIKVLAYEELQKALIEKRKLSLVDSLRYEKSV